jgi:hypothetical protein
LAFSDSQPQFRLNAISKQKRKELIKALLEPSNQRKRSTNSSVPAAESAGGSSDLEHYNKNDILEKAMEAANELCEKPKRLQIRAQSFSARPAAKSSRA